MVTSRAGQTAVIVPVEAAEKAVSRWRQRYDPGAILGVAAHVTVIFPFTPAALVNDAVIDGLSSVFAEMDPFDCTFAGCRWFGRDVLWLAPEPDQPFRDLTAAVLEAFPGYPPYGGAFDDVIPHLTIGESSLARHPDLLEAEAAVNAHLPIRTRIDGGLLVAGGDEPGSWRPLADLPFRRPDPH